MRDGGASTKDLAVSGRLAPWRGRRCQRATTSVRTTRSLVHLRVSLEMVMATVGLERCARPSWSTFLTTPWKPAKTRASESPFWASLRYRNGTTTSTRFQISLITIVHAALRRTPGSRSPRLPLLLPGSAAGTLALGRYHRRINHNTSVYSQETRPMIASDQADPGARPAGGPASSSDVPIFCGWRSGGDMKKSRVRPKHSCAECRREWICTSS